MITLTNPFVAVAALGGTSGVTYDVVDVIVIHFDVPGVTISGTIELRSSATQTAPHIPGTFNINAGDTPTITVKIPEFMNWSFSAPLTALQKTNLVTGITNAQNQLETALLGVGVVVGLQTTGI